MRVLRETSVRADPGTLADAWTASPTFALLPDKTSVDERWLAAALASVPAWARHDHFVMLTSGTTGAPKLVVGSRARAEALARVLHVAQDGDPVEETIVCLPLSYTYAFVNQWVWARVHGRRLHLASAADPAALATRLAAAKSAMLCLVGVQVELLARAAAGASHPGVERVHFAGARFPTQRLEELAAMFPRAVLFNNYGCAEAMPRLTLRRVVGATDAADVGSPIAGVELRAGPDAALEFRSPYAAVGVVDGDGVFASLEEGAWIATGDLARPEPDGTWRLLGRRGDVFKRHGERVSIPALSGSIAGAWAGELAFYREPDDLGEDGCVLVLAPAERADPAALRAVLGALRRHHPRAAWPLRIEAVAALPTLPNGKIDLESLRTEATRAILWRQHIGVFRA